MKRAIFFLIILLVSVNSFDARGEQVERREKGNLVIEGIPAIPQRIVDRMMQYQNTRSASLQGWEPAGKGIFISTRFGETSQIHYIEEPGGARKQLTFFSEPVRGAAVCPDTSRHGFLFEKDVGGGEFYQIFYFDIDTGSYEMLTDGESRNGGAEWSNGGDRFAFYSTKRNGRDWDIYVSGIENPNDTKPVVEEGGFWFPGEWSPDDSQLLVARYVSANESYGYMLDLQSGELNQIDPSKEKVSYGGACWARDGKGIFYTSDEGSEFKLLRYYDLNKKKSNVLTKDIPWDVEDFATSAQGDKLAFTTNEDGIGKLYILDTASLKYEWVPGIPVGQIYGLEPEPAGKRLALVINTPQTPGDVYVMDFDDYALVRWTDSEVGGLDTHSFIVPELIHYETFDKVDGKQRMIPAFYYKPGKGKAPYPVVINIHGGPEGQ
ncbi:MAG: S9 family peptidase, partial [Candidatus Krumholzibacteria bacterium]|nr:S9 family peptidase [Candidatus Krumholzibacteria bacterium]